ncbi:hypothetical protein GGS23DRAFT_614624 [Durotheca rogersii]|uniref:uncharacterized protein n=1 Tax=Durotheca rogersii TaxID=419775 RepID=UPI00221E840E|nr:uncharacterized protein GGS23DRAFT_614624 [Durotheca rogersii]KAI5859810.1 hypothetical protein GGS23DRAFT_614624 [Durotheca rogersii]
MKAAFFPLVLSVYASIGGVLASPSPLPLGVEVVERDDRTLVREVPHEHLQVEKRCKACKDDGEKCAMGEGNCKDGYCTWCGDHCGSICVPAGSDCKTMCH